MTTETTAPAGVEEALRLALDDLQNAVHDWETAPLRGETRSSTAINAARAAAETAVRSLAAERDRREKALSEIRDAACGFDVSVGSVPETLVKAVRTIRRRAEAAESRASAAERERDEARAEGWGWYEKRAAELEAIWKNRSERAEASAHALRERVGTLTDALRRVRDLGAKGLSGNAQMPVHDRFRAIIEEIDDCALAPERNTAALRESPPTAAPRATEPIWTTTACPHCGGEVDGIRVLTEAEIGRAAAAPAASLTRTPRRFCAECGVYVADDPATHRHCGGDGCKGCAVCRSPPDAPAEEAAASPVATPAESSDKSKDGE